MTTVLEGSTAPTAAPGNLRWWALGALSFAILAVGVDGTVLSVALPTLSKALHASESDLQWFSSGYFLVLAAAMLPAGLLGDRYGRKKVLVFSLGLFGVIAYAVSERTHEIGMRMALGAAPREVLRLVVGQGMRLALIGLLAGLPLALGMGRAVAGLLYGVAPDDFATFAGVAAILAGVALAACYIPARRAMRTHPMAALKYE